MKAFPNDLWGTEAVCISEILERADTSIESRSFRICSKSVLKMIFYYNLQHSANNKLSMKKQEQINKRQFPKISWDLLLLFVLEVPLPNEDCYGLLQKALFENAATFHVYLFCFTLYSTFKLVSLVTVL